MNPALIIPAVNASLALLEALLPEVQRLAQKGDITALQQQELLKKYNSLKTQADGQFSGPEWQVK